MDDTDKKLYAEENRQALLDLNKSISDLKGLIKQQIDQYKPPKDEVEVTGNVEVNTEPVVEVENFDEVTDALDILGDQIATAIKDNSYKPIKEVTVKNLPTEVSINNLKDLSNYFTTLAKTIEANKPIVNITKQEVVFPTSPNKPMAVRLSDGKAFYTAMAAAMSGSVDVSTLATESTLAKTVGFDANADTTTSIVTVGTVKTITQTDGVKTCTITIDATDANNKSITKEWS